MATEAIAKIAGIYRVEAELRSLLERRDDHGD